MVEQQQMAFLPLTGGFRPMQASARMILNAINDLDGFIDVDSYAEFTMQVEDLEPGLPFQVARGHLDLIWDGQLATPSHFVPLTIQPAYPTLTQQYEAYMPILIAGFEVGQNGPGDFLITLGTTKQVLIDRFAEEVKNVIPMTKLMTDLNKMWTVVGVDLPGVKVQPQD